MIREQFFEDKINGYSTISVQRLFDQVWEKVVAFEKISGYSLDHGYTRQQYVDLFNSMHLRRSSTFPSYKGHVSTYVKYLVTHGAVEQEQEDILASITTDDLQIWDNDTVIYYKNLEQLCDAVEETIKFTKSYDDTMYDVPISALFLAWYGLTEEEVIDYRKEDILDDGIMLRGQKIGVPNRVLTTLRRLRDADGYYQKARGIIFHTYLPSENLLRTERNDKLDLTKLRGIISRLNKVSNRVFSLQFKVVWQSGVFFRAYMQECRSPFDLNDPKFASTIFCEDLGSRSKQLSRIRDYKLYKKLF